MSWAGPVCWAGWPRQGRLRAVSLFSWSVEQNAPDTQMTTRVTEGFAAQRSRARALPLLNLKKKRDCLQCTAKVTFIPVLH